MDSSSSASTEISANPSIKQFSIFLPNKVGALSEVVKALSDNSVHVMAVNVQDSADSAIVRIIVSDPEQVQDIFTIHDIPFSICDIVAVEMREGATELPNLLGSLLMAEVNIHGIYGLMSRPHGNTALALHVEDNDCATAVLRSHGFKVLSQMDISR